jgi:hypothetical protein
MIGRRAESLVGRLVRERDDVVARVFAAVVVGTLVTLATGGGDGELGPAVGAIAIECTKL